MQYFLNSVWKKLLYATHIGYLCLHNHVLAVMMFQTSPLT